MNSSQALTSLVGRGCFRLVAAGTFDLMRLFDLHWDAFIYVATPSLHLIGACLAIVVVFLKFFTCRFSSLALIYLRRISSMVQISCGVILILKIIQTGLIFRLSTL